MAFWTYPIYETKLALNIADAFAVASEFALAFSIRKLDKERLRIVVNLTSMPSRFLFFTWIKAYEIRVHFLEERLSLVRAQAQRVISPHHLVRFPFFIAHRIEPEELFGNLQRHFSQYEAGPRTADWDN
ncbi:MAG: hypothetical protein PVG78_09440 [Desulfobacterales bacterium]